MLELGSGLTEKRNRIMKRAKKERQFEIVTDLALFGGIVISSILFDVLY